jgi:hypothetical protein
MRLFRRIPADRKVLCGFTDNRFIGISPGLIQWCRCGASGDGPPAAQTPGIA